MGHFSFFFITSACHEIVADLTMKWQLSPPGSRDKRNNRSGLPASRGGVCLWEPGLSLYLATWGLFSFTGLSFHYTEKEKDDKCSFQVAGPSVTVTHIMVLQKWTSGCSLPAVTSHLRTATCFPASICPSSDWLQGDGGLHSFTCSLCQVPGSCQAMGITAASISPPTMTPALALPCLWAQDLPAKTYISFPEGSFWPSEPMSGK